VNITSGTIAKNQKLRGAFFAEPDGDDGRRHDGNGACDQPPSPAGKTYVEKAFHDDLAGERRRNRRIEPAAQ
jgi:hypothetical protein